MSFTRARSLALFALAALGLVACGDPPAVSPSVGSADGSDAARGVDTTAGDTAADAKAEIGAPADGADSAPGTDDSGAAADAGHDSGVDTGPDTARADAEGDIAADAPAGDGDTAAAAALGAPCDPCLVGDDCAAGNLCAIHGPAVGAFCAPPCASTADCAAGYECHATPIVGAKPAKVCVLAKGADGASPPCPCSPAAIAAKAKTPCSAANALGVCSGVRTCGPAGLSACSAALPQAEMCDGADDDCDGQIDEGACDDGEACTIDACDLLNGCSHLPGAGNTPCSDGSACTSGDACVEGACLGQPVDCNDVNPCTLDGCNPNSGCTNAPIQAGCSDGDPCTSGDACAGGACKGKPKACDDGDACTADTCQGGDGCVNLPTAATCSDGNVCTKGDTCSLGGCAGVALDCEDDNGCTADACDPVVGCVHAKLTGACSDGNVCTSADACTNGVCTGQPTGCDDKNPCTTETCKPGLGCVFSPVPPASPCDDQSACTQGDVCLVGACTGVVIACADGNPCTDDGCDKIKGCTFLPNAATCTDANTCTTKDTCKNGSCSGAALACNDNNPCTTDSCKPGQGCVSLPAAATAPCNDGNACTAGDACKNGACLPGTAPVSCDDASPCTADSCDKVKGCVYLPTAATCSDGNPCTLGDSCAGGTCLPGGATLTCNDANACTADSCAAKSGCVNAPVAGPCTDNNLCTTGEVCAAGVCKPASVKTCDDGNVCTDDTCTPTTALCKYAFNTQPCSDGVACTVGDSCVQGACVGKATANLWSAHFGLPGSQHFGDLAKVGTEFAVFSNAVNPAAGTSTALVVRFDGAGKVAWQATFSKALANYPRRLAGLADGSLLAAYATTSATTGVDIEVTRLTPTGAVSWTKAFPTAGADWAEAIVALADGSFALGVVRDGSVGTANQLVVERYSATGTKLWTALAGSTLYVDRLTDLIATSDGGFAAVGFTMGKGAGGSDGWLVKLTSAGTIAWDAAFGGAKHDRFVRVVEVAGGGYGLYGVSASKATAQGLPVHWLVRTDAAGKLTWDQAIAPFPAQAFNTGLEFTTPAADLAATSDKGFFLLAAETTATSDLNLRALRTTSTGAVVWTRAYGDKGIDQPWAVLTLPSDHLLLAGARQALATLEIRPWVVRADAWGNPDCASSGLCATVSPATCGDDANLCTDDGCDPVKGCVKVPNGATCSADGVACTPDQCLGGSCVAGKPNAALCDDGKPWTADVCAVPSGCANPCSDPATAKPAQRVTVPAGDFWMGCNAGVDSECGADEKPAHKVTLSAYEIDVFEVTVAQYKQCVAAGKCTVPASANAACNYAAACKDQHPINCVSWTQASAYCNWVGGRLPTEAEWEKAARGGCEKVGGTNCAAAMPKYPWGNSGWGCANAITQGGCGVGSTWPVGSRPTGKSPYGVHDLVGNVLEWTADFYASSFYAVSPPIDPKGPATGSSRVVRGGAFATYMSTAQEQRCGSRLAYAPTFIGFGAGFRCVLPKP